MEWYYTVNRQQSGPVTQSEFESLVKNKTIGPDTLVWNPGMEGWKKFSELSSAPPAGPGLPPVGSAACAQCGQTFPVEEMIPHGAAHICAQCKPVFLQRLQEGLVVHGAMRYAGFWIRFLAKFIDEIILGIVQLVVLLPMGFMNLENPESISVMAFANLLPMVFSAVYNTFFVGRFAATPGKMALGIKIVMSDGERVSYWRALGRHFAQILSGIILGIGYIMAGFDVEKRSLHDRICDTRVIHKQ